MSVGAATGAASIRPGALLKHELAERGWGIRRVGGASMEPTIHVGESVRIVAAPVVRCGDVVVADICGALVVHRALVVRETGIVCCGDNLRRRDPAIAPDAVYGVAIAIQGGRRLRGGPMGIVFARGRFWAGFLYLVGRALLADFRLLRRQIAGDGVMEMWGRRWPPEGRDAVRLDPEMADQLIAGAQRQDGGSLSSATPLVGAIEIPAGVYCGLPAVRRRLLLSALKGSRIDIWVLPAQGLRLHITDALRWALRRAGRVAGESGDGAVRGRDGRWRIVHHFTASDLRDELALGGGRDIQMGVATVLGGPLLRASAQL